jgi:hypothetical protein
MEHVSPVIVLLVAFIYDSTGRPNSNSWVGGDAIAQRCTTIELSAYGCLESCAEDWFGSTTLFLTQ